MARPCARGPRPERGEDPCTGMARASPRRSLAALGMTTAAHDDAPSSLPAFRPFRLSVLPPSSELRLEAQHPAERELIITCGPVLRQLGSAHPQWEVEPRHEPRVADPVLRAKPDPGVAKEPD